MKIGTKLQLEALDPKTMKNEKYHCKVIDKNKSYLFIDLPIHQRTKRSSFLPLNTKITVTFLDQEKIAHQFESKIVKKGKYRIPTLAILLPAKEQIKKIQRRNFVRIETAVDVAVHSLQNALSPFTTVTSDISGGGMSIILPQDVSLQQGEKLEATIVLPMHSGENVYITANGEVVNIKEANRRIQLAAVKFIHLDSHDQQKIIQFCFEKQREARQKELM